MRVMVTVGVHVAVLLTGVVEVGARDGVSGNGSNSRALTITRGQRVDEVGIGAHVLTSRVVGEVVLAEVPGTSTGGMVSSGVPVGSGGSEVGAHVRRVNRRQSSGWSSVDAQMTHGDEWSRDQSFDGRSRDASQ